MELDSMKADFLHLIYMIVRFESNLSTITRLVTATQSLQFALFNYALPVRSNLLHSTNLFTRIREGGGVAAC